MPYDVLRLRALIPFAALAAVLLGAEPAQARGFTISDFGSVRTDTICVQKARLVLERYGAREILTTGWTVNAYGLGGEDALDAAVVCAYGPNGRTQVSFVLHSAVAGIAPERRAVVASKLRAIWDRY